LDNTGISTSNQIERDAMDPILETLTDFATGLEFRDLPARVVVAAGERVMDALGCAVGAYHGDTVEIARAMAGPAAPGALAGHMVGTSRTAAADAAAFVNTCMVRHIDFNDTYLPGGHPSDSAGGLFAIAPQIGASGEQLIAATVVAYEIFIRLQASAQLREKGWDQGFGVGIGTVDQPIGLRITADK